ncbi:MAG: cell division protein CrgA [Micrococcales bacterium]|nr:cell division protein CrgA [Micrococcales bacterium]
MPESRSRAKKKVVYKPPPGKKAARPSPGWWAPAMVTLMIAGLAYVVWTYVGNTGGPIRSLGQWNLGIGLGAILLGFAMTMRWR